MSHNWWKILAALILTGLSMGQLHAADGLYLGAGIGAASFKDDLESGITFDEEDAAYKAFIGWRFDAVPVIDLAVEVAYTDFGKPSQGVNAQQFEIKLRGPSIAGLLILPLGPLDLYAKAGVIDYELDRTSAGTTRSSWATIRSTAQASVSISGSSPSAPNTSATRSRISTAWPWFRSTPCSSSRQLVARSISARN